jgi:hypothetical protein
MATTSKSEVADTKKPENPLHPSGFFITFAANKFTNSD